MLTTKKVVYRTLKVLLIFYVVICVALYFFQEKLIFFPDKVDRNFKFSFGQTFEEVNIKTEDGNTLMDCCSNQTAQKVYSFISTAMPGR